jgi:hypothetical protein
MRTQMKPPGVNLAALLNRFSSTPFSRSGSPIRHDAGVSLCGGSSRTCTHAAHALRASRWSRPSHATGLSGTQKEEEEEEEEEERERTLRDWPIIASTIA